MRASIVLLALMTLACSGCARMIVRKDPAPNDTGIRFYRPKPYLFIGPAEKADKPDQVTMKIEYLPDYSEEYSIRTKPGLGTTKMEVHLDQGWNLVSVNSETDQKYAEIIGSLAQLAGAAAKGAAGAPVAQTYGGTVETNVPLGYYEAVLAVNECGKRELMGWRYIGFMPLPDCPIKASVCRDHVMCGQEPLFSLVYEGNKLKMKRMDQLCSSEPYGGDDEIPVSQGVLPPPMSRSPRRRGHPQSDRRAELYPGRATYSAQAQADWAFRRDESGEPVLPR
ncbi:MAG TPA: hypothetical protein VGG64_09985 [Pirellulales bacterium]